MSKFEEHKQFYKLYCDEVNVHKLWTGKQGIKEGKIWNIVFNNDISKFELEDPKLWAFARKFMMEAKKYLVFKKDTERQDNMYELVEGTDVFITALAIYLKNPTSMLIVKSIDVTNLKFYEK